MLTNITEDDARSLFPLRADDPALNYLFSSHHELLTASDAPHAFMEWIVDNPCNVTWGIMRGEDEPLLGFAALTLSCDKELPGYTILLRTPAQQRGVGTLATAAVVAAAAQDGLLFRANTWYPLEATPLTTYIHPENTPSRRMCSRMGFILEGSEWVEDAGEEILSYRLDLGNVRRVAMGSSIILADTHGDNYQVKTYV